ncbi:hypothetical protein NRB20_48130 [Nocardia sp. RB20]|uniref:Uncharacterized protein n=1 Tax=Nocardia macrotermitis TaxID=2585198 RepID=A0A7K0D7E7_9NOCA|nr:hypothetical protein [Nocardia macrotermitis]
MAYKLIEAARNRWRKINAPELVARGPGRRVPRRAGDTTAPYLRPDLANQIDGRIDVFALEPAAEIFTALVVVLEAERARPRTGIHRMSRPFGWVGAVVPGGSARSCRVARPSRTMPRWRSNL